jgi:hypothetical protein
LHPTYFGRNCGRWVTVFRNQVGYAGIRRREEPPAMTGRLTTQKRKGIWVTEMKKVLLTTVGLVALGAAPALAADLPARTYTKAPAAVAPIYNWGGFYIGINGGGASSHKCWDMTSVGGIPLPFTISEGCHDATGGLAGGQIGYR